VGQGRRKREERGDGTPFLVLIAKRKEKRKGEKVPYHLLKGTRGEKTEKKDSLTHTTPSLLPSLSERGENVLRNGGRKGKKRRHAYLASFFFFPSLSDRLEN